VAYNRNSTGRWSSN